MEQSFILAFLHVQGLDVLEIMRHIQEFVTKYAYNLNNQVQYMYRCLHHYNGSCGGSFIAALVLDFCGAFI